MEMPQLAFDAPIAGQSLTAGPGDRPWRNPPQFATPEDALEFYIPKLLDPQYSDKLLDILEMGTPITVIANALQSVMVMEGKHSLDVGMLVMPVLVELIEIIAMNANIDYVKGTDSSSADEEKLSEEKITKVIAKLKLEDGEKMIENVEKEMPKGEEIEEEEPKGLMARRQQ
jgi:hypothetical protein